MTATSLTPSRWTRLLPGAAVLLIWLAVVFSPCLRADFVNWDDQLHLLENPLVRSLTPSDITAIFHQNVQKIYIPLTTLSFAVEYHFVKLAPFAYHLDNVILHMAVTLLVAGLGWRMGLSPRAAFCAGLLFGIHPMRAESVAWVTERKDVLYAFFYMLALHQYWSYLKTKKLWPYSFALAFGLLSILAKPMALSLPLLLCLLDRFYGRPLGKGMVLDKIPFFLYIGGITWLTYSLLMRNPVHDIGQALALWLWTFGFYLWKFVCPVHVYPYYHPPLPIALGHWPYIASAFLFAAFWAGVWLGRRSRWFLFALLVFFLSTFFLYRFDLGKDTNIVADRFMYLPSFGFCFLIGLGADRLLTAAQGQTFRRAAVAGVLIVVAGLLSLRTWAQCGIWHDSVTLWNYSIRYYPTAYVAFNNRGNAYNELGKLELAIADYNRSLVLRPDYARTYNNRGTVYAKMNENTLALADFEKCLSLDPHFGEAMYNESVIYLRLDQYPQALEMARRARAAGVQVPDDYMQSLEDAVRPVPGH